MFALARRLLPRQRIWRFVEVSSRPRVIGLELVAVAALSAAGLVELYYLVVGGLIGAALAVHFWNSF